MVSHVESAGAIVYRINNGVREYLLINNVRNFWDFPKGKVEKGERKQDAAVREVAEETGLGVTLDEQFTFSFSYEFIEVDGKRMSKTVTLWCAQVPVDAKVTISGEHTQFVWASYAKAGELVSYQNARDALKAVEFYLS